MGVLACSADQLVRPAGKDRHLPVVLSTETLRAGSEEGPSWTGLWCQLGPTGRLQWLASLEHLNVDAGEQNVVPKAVHHEVARSKAGQGCRLVEDRLERTSRQRQSVGSVASQLEAAVDATCGSGVLRDIDV